MIMNTVMQISNLDLFYGSFHALKNVNLLIEKQKITALIGPSGCGKSTILRILAGLMTPTQGEVLYHGTLLAGLNPAQQQAVLHTGPPLIVQAGPGTGKTRALTHRLAHLLARRQVPPEKILALTFTRQAAGGMEARIGGLLPDFPGLSRLTIKTFHALGHQILAAQEETAREVAAEDQRRQLIRQAARKQKVPVARLDDRIIQWKQALKYPEDLGEANEPEAAAFKDYEVQLRREGLWDYEDLIARPTLLLTRQPGLQEAYRRRFMSADRLSY